MGNPIAGRPCCKVMAVKIGPPRSTALARTAVHAIAALRAEHEDRAAERVLLQDRLHCPRQTIGAAAEIDKNVTTSTRTPGGKLPDRAAIMSPSTGGQSCRETTGRRPHRRAARRQRSRFRSLRYGKRRGFPATSGTKSGRATPALQAALQAHRIATPDATCKANCGATRGVTRSCSLPPPGQNYTRQSPPSPPRSSVAVAALPVRTSTRRKLCPSIGKLLGKPASLPRPTKAGSSVRPQLPKYASSASLEAVFTPTEG